MSAAVTSATKSLQSQLVSQTLAQTPSQLESYERERAIEEQGKLQTASMVSAIGSGRANVVTTPDSVKPSASDSDKSGATTPSKQAAADTKTFSNAGSTKQASFSSVTKAYAAQSLV